MASKLIDSITLDDICVIEVFTDEVFIVSGNTCVDSMSDLTKVAKLYNALAKYLEANGVEFDW